MFIMYTLGEDVTTRNEAMGAHTPWNLSGGPGMSHVFQIPDDLYEKLAAYAAQQEQTPETLLLAWVSEITRRLEASQPSDYDHKNQANRVERTIREKELSESPLFQIAGIFAIGDPGWADKHDEYLAEGYSR